MRPAFSKAPLDYLFALAVCALIVGLSFAVEPSATQWSVFGVGAAMGVIVAGLAVRPVRS